MDFGRKLRCEAGQFGGCAKSEVVISHAGFFLLRAMFLKIGDFPNFIHAIVDGPDGSDFFRNPVEKKGVVKVHKNIVLNVIVPDDIFDRFFNDPVIYFGKYIVKDSLRQGIDGQRQAWGYDRQVCWKRGWI